MAAVSHEHIIELIRDALYHERPLSHNLQILAFLTNPDNIKRTEDTFHLPITGTVEGLKWNFPRVHLTIRDESPPVDPSMFVTWAAKIINDCRVDILDVHGDVVRGYMGGNAEVPVSILAYAALDGRSDFYFYLLDHDFYGWNVLHQILIGAGLSGDMELIDEVLGKAISEARDPKPDTYRGVIFVGALYGGHVELMDQLFARIKNFNLFNVAFFRRKFEFTDQAIMTYDRPFTFLSYEGLWHVMSDPKYKDLKSFNMNTISFKTAMWYALLTDASVDILERYREIVGDMSIIAPVPASISAHGLKWLQRTSDEAVTYAVRINDITRVKAALELGYDNWMYIALCLKKYRNVPMTRILLPLHPELGTLIMRIIFRRKYIWGEGVAQLNLGVLRAKSIYIFLQSQGVPEPETIPYPLKYTETIPGRDPHLGFVRE